jgi:SAM-dependent methyltransferase
VRLVARDAVLVACSACGLVRVDPWPTREQALALYGPTYLADAGRGYVDYVGDEPLFAREMRLRLQALQAIGVAPRGARLLDIGCASGVLLKEARERGLVAAGLEPHPDVARLASERSGCPVTAAPLDRAWLATASRDLVTMFDVLEHLVDPRDALERVRRAVLPGGAVAITVPDFGGWWARVQGARWPFVTPWEHLTYFTRRTLVGLLEAAGFTQVQVLHARTPCSLATLASRLRGRTAARGRGRGLLLPFGTLFVVARA